MCKKNVLFEENIFYKFIKLFFKKKYYFRK